MFSLLPFMTLHAQEDYKKNIEQEFNAYLAAITSGNYAQSLEYTMDELFEIAPKEQMLTMMEQTFNSPELKIELKDPKINSIDDYKQVDGNKYAFMSYSLTMKMVYLKQEDISVEEHTETLKSMKPLLDASFGEENVSFIEGDNAFEIFSEKNAYAVEKEAYNNWKFIVIEKNQKPTLEMLLPKELVDELFKED
jgi:hypothetical protein